MTDLEKWLEDCRNKLEPPRPSRVALKLLLEDFPEALRMLEVAANCLKYYAEIADCEPGASVHQVLSQLDQMARGLRLR